MSCQFFGRKSPILHTPVQDWARPDCGNENEGMVVVLMRCLCEFPDFFFERKHHFFTMEAIWGF